jgi:hypothetical protein
MKGDEVFLGSEEMVDVGALLADAGKRLVTSDIVTSERINVPTSAAAIP